MSDFYDKDGEPISMEQWSELFAKPKYRIIASDNVADYLWISTVWLGLDHRIVLIDPGSPLIFETMVFVIPQGDDRWASLEQERYSTLEQAIAGHERILGLIKEVEEA